MDAPTCPYCEQPAEQVNGEIVYPHRLDLAGRKFWRCKKCKAYVGCHPKTGKPLGTLANETLRKARMEAHSWFDGLWKHEPNQGAARTIAYQWLAKELTMEKKACHIGEFSLEQCKAVIKAVKKRRKQS